jgi:transcriptional regulator with XRE-family HTH domain
MEIEKTLHEFYELGFNAGSIETKNKILKTLNRDIDFFLKYKPNEILDKIDSIKLPKPNKPITNHSEA